MVYPAIGIYRDMQGDIGIYTYIYIRIYRDTYIYYANYHGCIVGIYGNYPGIAVGKPTMLKFNGGV